MRHGVVGGGEQGGLDVPAPFESARHVGAADDQSRAFVLPDLDVAADPLLLALGDQRAHLGVGIGGIAHPQGGHLGSQRVDVLVVTPLGHQHTGQRVADLPTVGQAGRSHSGGDGFGCGVIEDDRGGLAAEFETDLGQVGRARRRDGPTGRGRTGERHLVHAADG